MRIGTDKPASVYECVRSCRYSVSSECHLMETGHRMNWLVVVKKKRTSGGPITDCGCVGHGEVTQVSGRMSELFVISCHKSSLIRRMIDL